MEAIYSNDIYALSLVGIAIESIQYNNLYGITLFLLNSACEGKVDRSLGHSAILDLS